jgi:undecaprenyl-diphosphatase
MDQATFQAIFSLAGQNVFVDTIAIFFARYLPYLLVIGFFVLLLGFRSGRERMFFFAQAVLIGILSRGILVELIRYFYDRPRPFEVFGIEPLVAHSPLEPSLPSGHAAFYFGLALAAWFMNRRWGGVYIVLASLMGFARVIIGVHWPTDVLAGAVLGIISAFFVRWLIVGYRPEVRVLGDIQTSEPLGSIGK